MGSDRSWAILAVGLAVGVVLLGGLSSAEADEITYRAGSVLLNGVEQNTSYDHLFHRIAENYNPPDDETKSYYGLHNPDTDNYDISRIAIAFDLDYIPDNQVITGVELKLVYLQSYQNDPDPDAELHEITRAGGTSPMVEDDVTWEDINGTDTWTAGGGDYATPAMQTATVTFTAGVSTTFLTSAAFVTAAQDAYDDDRPFEMLFLSADTEAMLDNTTRLAAFYSDDTGTATYRPLLTVTYTPEPATMLLVGTGLIGLIGTIRRRRMS